MTPAMASGSAGAAVPANGAGGVPGPALLSAAEAAEIAEGVLVAGPDAQIRGAATDSRQVKPGDLFVAIRGERVDGHGFVPTAVLQGAAAVLVDRVDPAWGLPPGVGVIRVADTVLALGKLGCHHRRRFSVRMTAVTGSVGKTTTKDLIASVLAQGFRLLKTEGNLNTEIGLPLTLFRLTPDLEAAVVEMGMRGLGQIRYLASLAEPTVGVITNIGRTHLELLGSEANIMQAKAELVEALPANGFAILNDDDPWTASIAERTKARVLRYGWERWARERTGATAAPDRAALRRAGATAATGATGVADAGVAPKGRPDIAALDVRNLGAEGVSFRLVTPAGEAEVLLPVPGMHNVANALAAAAVGHAWGLSPGQIAAGLGRASISDKRLNVIRVGSITILNDTYNASPVSTRAALEVLGSLEAGRKLAVLGNMLELGQYAREGHREVGQAAAGIGLGALVCVGDLAADIAAGAREAGMPADRIHQVPDRRAAMPLLAKLVQPGDAVLVKGSRGMVMEEIVAGLEHRWGAGEAGEADDAGRSGSSRREVNGQ